MDSGFGKHTEYHAVARFPKLFTPRHTLPHLVIGRTDGTGERNNVALDAYEARAGAESR